MQIRENSLEKEKIFSASLRNAWINQFPNMTQKDGQKALKGFITVRKKQFQELRLKSFQEKFQPFTCGLRKVLVFHCDVIFFLVNVKNLRNTNLRL